MRVISKTRKMTGFFALGAILLFSACAAQRAAVEHIARADLAIHQTQQTEAEKYAPAELHQAQEKLDAAKKAEAAGDYKESRQLSNESIINTQLAEAKVLSEKAQNNVYESRKTTETLRKETQRNRDARQAN